jgi:DNA-binding response OmpR family regulator
MSSRKIIVVDDQQDILDLIRLGVALETDWDVATYRSVSDVTRTAAPADAVLLDLSVAGDDAEAVITHLRAATNTAPVVLLTGTALRGDEVRRVGAAGLIAKPFDVLTLAGDLSDLLGWN